jgi:hypothetical protein
MTTADDGTGRCRIVADWPAEAGELLSLVWVH